MADTVTASVIVASLGDSGPSFISTEAFDVSAVSGAVHVAGGVSAQDATSGFGSPLLVDFVNVGAIAAPTDLSPTVAGQGGTLLPIEFGPVVPGSSHQF